LDLGSASSEVILATSVAANTVTCVRNANGQGSFTHLAGCTFNHTSVAADDVDASAHINAITGVHGVVGTIADTSSTQSLCGEVDDYHEPQTEWVGRAEREQWQAQHEGSARQD
jgi:hypothetical protein